MSYNLQDHYPFPCRIRFCDKGTDVKDSVCPSCQAATKEFDEAKDREAYTAWRLKAEKAVDRND